MKVAIVDYGMGNLRSVANAFEWLGCDANIVERPRDLEGADRIVLPGVGAFGDGIRKLRTGGWIDTLEEEVRRKGKLFLGVCLGMQLLATTSTEHGTHNGMNWIPGVVERIQCEDIHVRVPHIGWNDVYFTGVGPLYGGMESSGVFYFAHSYVFRPTDLSVVNGVCHHGIEFAASVGIGNIFATQYHPEKSQSAGLAVLKNFLRMGG